MRLPVSDTTDEQAGGSLTGGAHARKRLWLDRMMRAVIIGSGLLCLALLAWDHLGAGALLFPPALTAPHQDTQAGPYQARLTMPASGLTAYGPNTITLAMRDGAGAPLAGATVTIAPVMTTMPMEVPPTQGQLDAQGQLVAHPRFGMAGDWRLNVTIQRTGAPPEHASFVVSVRWR